MTDTDGRKVAFVTGSGKGIGAGIAAEMARSGYDVIVHYARSEDGARKTKELVEAEGAKAFVVRGDITNIDEIDTMFADALAEAGRIDVMINNAGVTRFASFLEVTPELFQEVIYTDLRGSFFCAQRAARSMVERGIRGTIINITSNHQNGCWPIASVYGPAKAALNKFTQNAAMELAAHGIRVVSVAPGYTKTGGDKKPPPSKFSDWLKTRAARIPLNRFCEPWEVGRACVFLAGEGAGYITGTCLVMDGGALLPCVPENTFM